MGPQWEEKETRYSLDPPLMPVDGDLYKISVSEATGFLPQALPNNGKKETRVEAVNKDDAGQIKSDESDTARLTGLQVVREVGRTVFYIGLLLGEGALWTSLYSEIGGVEEEYRDYLVLWLVLPTIVNCGVCLSICQCVGLCGQQAAIFILLLLSVPSPILLHLYYLVEISRGTKIPCKINCLLIFSQLGHALTGSVPLILMGLQMMLRASQNEEKALAINRMADFLLTYPLYPLCLLVSFLLVLSSVHRYNERLSSSVVSVLVSLPFTLVTLVVRLSAAAMLLTFQSSEILLLLLTSLTATSLAVELLTSCGSGQVHTPAVYTKGDKRQEKEPGSEPDMLDCLASGSCKRLMSSLPGHLARALGSIVIPLGYESDAFLGQRRTRKGLYLCVNFFLVMGVLGTALGWTIWQEIPGTLHGLEMAQMGLQLEVPETQVVVKSMSGVDIHVNLPSNLLDLGGSGSGYSASMVFSPWVSLVLSVSTPLVLVLLSLPLTLTRAALLGLDCVLIRRQAGSLEDRRRGLGQRLSCSLSCGLLGAFLTFLVLLVVVAGLGMHMAA